MAPWHRWSLTIFSALSASLSGCASTTPPAGVTAVTPFDLPRYLGRWYELARLDHRFERDMTDVSATYSLNPDGSVRVLNRGFDPHRNDWRDAVGKAWQTTGPQTASLKVSFFGPFYGGYHVAALAPDYRWSLVIGPTRDYCWILARDRQLTNADRISIVAQAQALGIDTQALIWVSQLRTDDQISR
jgi:apolipoprotein D and lipocalin family protein